MRHVKAALARFTADPRAGEGAGIGGISQVNTHVFCNANLKPLAAALTWHAPGRPTPRTAVGCKLVRGLRREEKLHRSNRNCGDAHAGCGIRGQLALEAVEARGTRKSCKPDRHGRARCNRPQQVASPHFDRLPINPPVPIGIPVTACIFRETIERRTA